MRFLLDENADLLLASHLADQGHDVTSIVRDYPRAIKDADILAIAQREERILITNDKDFGELIFHRHLPHAGVILFRLEHEPIPTKQLWLDRVLTEHSHELGSFIVIDDHGVRVRGEGMV